MYSYCSLVHRLINMYYFLIISLKVTTYFIYVAYNYITDSGIPPNFEGCVGLHVTI